MDGLILKGYRALELFYKNDIKGNNIQLALEYNAKTKATFRKKDSTCECFYDLKVFGKEEERIALEAHVLIAGQFDIPKDIEQKEVHVAAANELYPFVRAA